MSIHVTILGSGSATPRIDRFSSAQWIKVANSALMIDCGEGAQLQLMRFKVKPGKLQAVFISHLHGDHFLGLPGLLSTLNLNGRKAPLTIVSPPGLKLWLENQWALGETILQFPIIFKEIDLQENTLIFENKFIRVFAFPLMHRVVCHGFRIEEKEGAPNLKASYLSAYKLSIEDIKKLKAGYDIIHKGKKILAAQATEQRRPELSYVYCSDTIPFEQLHRYVQSADVLYHEATFASDLSFRAKATFHSTAQEAALIAKRAQVKKLIIGHFSARYDDIETLAKEAQAHFFETQAAFDGMTFAVE